MRACIFLSLMIVAEPTPVDHRARSLHYHIGVAQTQLGEYFLAAESFGRAVAHGADFAQVEEALIKLEETARLAEH
jgi:hypothetical protein